MGAPKKKVGAPPAGVYSIRIEDPDIEYFDFLKEELADKTGIPVSRTWVIAEMIRMGMPIFEKKYKLKRPVD